MAEKLKPALDAFVKTPRKDGEIACVVNQETLTREILEKLFQSVQLGPGNKSFATSKYCLVSAFEAITLWKFLPERLAY